MTKLDEKFAGVDKITEGYNPFVGARLERIDERWGTPERNAAALVPYYLPALDKALEGMDSMMGQLDIVQGPAKGRKTTFTINQIISVMERKPAGKVEPNTKRIVPVTVVDALESNMNADQYEDVIISNLATRILMEMGHKANTSCPVCGPRCKHMGLYAKFLRTHDRTKEQAFAIAEARSRMKHWPLLIYDAKLGQGNTRSLTASLERWEMLITKYDAKWFVIDHLQQYESPTGKPWSAYEQQMFVIPPVSGIVAKHSAMITLLSQVSLSSRNAAAQGFGEMMAAGGEKAKAEASNVFTMNYESGASELMVTLEDSRWSAPFSVMQPLDITSGAWSGDGWEPTGGKSDYRPGLKQRGSK